MEYIRRRFERRVRRLRQAKRASDTMARTIDNLVHLRKPTVGKVDKTTKQP
jgi:hypothetical protein